MTKPKKKLPDSGSERAPGAAVDLTTDPTLRSPAMPHERDESAGMTSGVPSGAMRQGARDLKRGLEDTSRAPEADDAYRKLRK